MNKFGTDAIVVRVSVTGESDRIVWLLTRSMGVIRAFAKGARKVGARLHSSSGLFVYGDFQLTESKGSYNITEAEIKEMFFPLRNDLDKLTLAQYFCETAVKCIGEGNSSGEHLRLILNCLYFLCENKKPAALLKPLYEMRTACLLGYAPDLVACSVCGTFETEYMYFDCSDGTLFCSACGNRDTLPGIPLSVVTAMRHFVFSSFEKLFSISCTDDTLSYLGRICEKYFLNCVQLKFDTLDFLHK